MTRMSRPEVSLAAQIHLKTPKKGVFGAGPGLAIRAVVIVCALASHSCLVPQSVDPIVESPHPPPHFVLDLIPSYFLVPILQLYRQGSEDQRAIPPCHCKLEFSKLFVEEDDPTITLQARWFVDYDPNVPRLAAAVFSNDLPPGNFNNTETIRPVPPHDFDADALIASNGDHVVEIVVAESAAFEASTTQPNRAVKTGYASAVYRFFVNVKFDQDPARPTCPDVPPSVRVCQ